MEAGNTKFIKKLNEKSVLNWIRKKDDVSRSDLARLTSLNPSTISDIVGRLISEKLVVEKGRGSSTGGRKPRLLNLNKKSFLYCGISVHLHLHAVILDIDGNVLAKTDIIPDNPRQIDVETLINGIKNVTRKAGIEVNELRGVGIGIPGQVNKDFGVVEYAPHVEWENFRLEEELQTELGVTVCIDNGMKARALGESWFGKGQNINNFVVLNVEEGIGAAIVIDNKVYRGFTQRAGEIGHNFASGSSQSTCRCGNRGCLETVAGSRALINSVQEAITQGYDFPFAELTLENIFTIWKNNEEEVIDDIISNVAFNLGVEVADLFNTLDPERMIVSGNVIETGGEILLKEIIEGAQKHVFGQLDNSRIIKSELGIRGVAIGAATLGMHEYFESSLLKTTQ
ncbi:MAG: ROK family transcriptional regulator [Halanaerobiales bacterium]